MNSGIARLFDDGCSICLALKPSISFSDIVERSASSEGSLEFCRVFRAEVNNKLTAVTGSGNLHD